MKKVIVHFSPSVRFLGLGLKILFHKNKEIKRMLSKKMTFSLMSLITLLALAFVVTPAMAAEFGVAMSIRRHMTMLHCSVMVMSNGTEIGTFGLILDLIKSSP